MKIPCRKCIVFPMCYNKVDRDSDSLAPIFRIVKCPQLQFGSIKYDKEWGELYLKILETFNATNTEAYKLWNLIQRDI